MPPLMSMIRLLRIKQWVKNAFIFFPLIFSGQLYHLDLRNETILTFIGFCLISSSVYILNDFLDRKKDRLHPKKALRPLAQMDIPAPLIFCLILGILAGGLWICLIANPAVLYIAGIYILLHLVYNFYTKHIVILDVIFVAFGFQIRIWAGALAAGVIPSEWLQLCVFLLALFLGFTKRRHEIGLLKDQAHEHRSVLSHYSVQLLDQIILICSTLAIVFYALYTISPDIVNRVGNHHMVYSVVFVIYGFFRYFYLSHVCKLGDEPAEILFSDIPLLINVLLWIGYIVFVLYTAKPI